MEPSAPNAVLESLRERGAMTVGRKRPLEPWLQGPLVLHFMVAGGGFEPPTFGL